PPWRDRRDETTERSSGRTSSRPGLVAVDAEGMQDRRVRRAEKERRLRGRAVFMLDPRPVRDREAIAGLPFELLITDDRPAAPTNDVKNRARVRPSRTRQPTRPQHVRVTADRRQDGPAGHGVVVLDSHAAILGLELGQLTDRALRPIPGIDEPRPSIMKRSAPAVCRCAGAISPGSTPCTAAISVCVVAARWKAGLTRMRLRRSALTGSTRS